MPQITDRLEQKVIKIYGKELWIGFEYEDDKFLRFAL